MELLRIQFIEGDPAVLHVDGDIDVSTAEQLRGSLEKALSINPGLVVDMEGVTFVDATGLRAILEVAASRNGAGPLQLVNAHRVTRLLEIVGLSELNSIVIVEQGDAIGR